MALTTRRRALTTLAAAVAGSVALPAYAQASDDGRHRPRPLWRAHAHNDYLHPRPLLDALGHRFGSVEADIFLDGKQLLVAHDPVDLDPVPDPGIPLPRPPRRPGEGQPRLGVPGAAQAGPAPHRHQDRGRVHVPGTRPPSAPLPPPVHDVRPRPGLPRRGDGRDLRRPRGPCSDGSPDRTACLLRRPPPRPPGSRPGPGLLHSADQRQLDAQLHLAGRRQRSPRPSARSCAASSRRRTPEGRRSASGPPRTWRVPPATRSGANSSRPTSTTSTPTTSRVSKPSWTPTQVHERA